MTTDDKPPVLTAEIVTAEDDEHAEKKRKRSQRHDPFLIVQAVTAYCSDADCSTVEKMARHPKFNTIPLNTLRRWRREQQWDTRRAEFQEAYIEQVKARYGLREAQKREAELEALESTIAKADTMLWGEKAVPPKSWEGVAKVRIELGKRREALIVAQASSFFPEKDSTSSDHQLLPAEQKLVEEYRRQTAASAAEQMLEARREALRAEIAASAAPAPASLPAPKTVALAPSLPAPASEPSPAPDLAPDVPKISPPRIEVAEPDRH